eukprot:Sdes_comp16037_c0_seq1m5237
MVKVLKAKKEQKLIHPNSRKAKQICKSMNRHEKLGHKKIDRLKAMSFLASKLLWFKGQLDPEVAFYSHSQMVELIHSYVKRNDEIIETHRDQKRIGKSRSIQAENMSLLLETEKNQLSSGFQAPDLTKPKNVEILRSWNGDLNVLPSFELKEFICIS